jgi:hypothetical protein
LQTFACRKFQELLEVPARKVVGSSGNSWKFRLAKLMEVLAIAGSSGSQNCWKFRQLLEVLARKAAGSSGSLCEQAPWTSL